MPNGYPSPYGKSGEDAFSVPLIRADVGMVHVVVAPGGRGPSDPGIGQPVTIPVPAAPRVWPDFTGHSGAEVRRVAKGEPPRTDEERRAFHKRPPGKRSSYPQPGQRIRFVRDDWADPEPAVVLAVQSPDDSDVNLLVNPDDPAPWVILQTSDGFVTRCREARVRGAAGWLP